MISPHYPSVPGRFGVLGDRRDVRGVLLCSGLRQEEGAGHILSFNSHAFLYFIHNFSFVISSCFVVNFAHALINLNIPHMKLNFCS